MNVHLICKTKLPLLKIIKGVVPTIGVPLKWLSARHLHHLNNRIFLLEILYNLRGNELTCSFSPSTNMMIDRKEMVLHLKENNNGMISTWFKHVHYTHSAPFCLLLTNFTLLCIMYSPMSPCEQKVDNSHLREVL